LTKKKPKLQQPPQPREAVFHPELHEDLQCWVQTDRKLALRTLQIVEAIMRDPFTGIGKPEPLKHVLAGAWSRRLTRVHRIVYVVKAERV